ncbi:HNH endonuclease [Streptomyces celluloflavus]|uniref:HNH endonuclease n=1 Tax=Streptomyces celluloflavus TaxID=58344 RepID=UPI0036979752
MDHVRPLSLGGEDGEGNVQVLCRSHHGLKTSTDFGAAGQQLLHSHDSPIAVAPARSGHSSRSQHLSY